mgnify:CR=1 FL=1
MKIAKKVLAIVMVVAMIGALSVMALAAEGKYVLSYEPQDDGTVAVTVTLKGMTGVTDDKFSITYDPAVLKIADPDIDVADGKDKEDMANVANNSLMGQANATEEGTFGYGYLFSEALSAEFLKAGRGKTVSIDPDNFDMIVIYFTVLNDKADTTLTISSDVYGGSSVTVKGTAPADDPTPVTPEKPDDGKKDEEKKDEDKKDEEKPAEDTSKPVNPSNGDKKTGDNMALAAAGAVVALAGVAFVISKKRK